MNSLTTEDIQRAAGTGDETLARRLIDEFHPRIFAYLRRLAGSDTEAADLTQRTFSRAWQSLATFAGKSSPVSWLHGIAYHLFVDWLRARRQPEEKGEAWWNDLPALGPRPDEIAASRDTAALVYQAVDHLEPELRDTVHLHYYQGLTIEETAEALEIATSTVKYRAREAISRLQRALETNPSPRLNTSLLSTHRRL